MRLTRYLLASTEVLLISPAVLFMAALFVRNLQPQEYEPAHTAQQIVIWYAARTRVGLWLFLIALPLAVLLTGCATLMHRWSSEIEMRQAARQILAVARTHATTLLVAGTTIAAGGVLAIVALHLMTE